MRRKPSLRPYVTIAGSGPSVEGWTEPVTIATKKRSVPSEFVAASTLNHLDRWRDRDGEHFNHTDKGMVFRGGKEGSGRLWWSAGEKAWTKYFQQFSPKFYKPSIGTLAVFMAYERWGPERIGLIGLDDVLDGNDEWFHDARAEREAIMALDTEIIDLRVNGGT